MSRLAVFVAGMVLTTGPATPSSAQQVHPELDRFVRALVARAAPLALSVVVVRRDSVVHLAGYGLRDREQSLPVTPQSSFYIASSTKSFTALTAALLAARGVVDLEAPVTRYAPEFRLPPPLDVSRITLRRLLSHRAGFESGPLSFRTAYTGDLVPDSLLAVVARSAVPVDTTFTYTNTAFIVAARVLERATGTRWQQLVADEILNPLGLRRTTAVPSSAQGWELVQGYGPGPDGFRVVPPKSDETMHAAGGILMSAEDAGRWLRAQLTGGRVSGRPHLPAAVLASTHQPQAVYAATTEGIRRIGYALGWQIGILDGDTLYHHLGNYPGAFAHVSFIPSRGIGVAVFANSDMPAFGPVTGTIATHAYDLLLERGHRGATHAAFIDSIGPRRDRMAEVFRVEGRRRAARPQVPPRGWGVYVGQYHGGDMGSVSVVARGNRAAELRYGQLRAPLEVFSGDTLRVEVPPGRTGRPMPVTFGADGRVSSVTVAGIVFTRIDGSAAAPSPTPAPPPLRGEEVVILGRDGRRLAGTLTLPAEGGPPFPAVVTLTGSGAHFRDGNRTPEHPYRPFRQIAEALAAKGIATLRLDDRGVGGSTGDAVAATGDDVADDARVAIAWLRRRAGIDPTRIAVIGHSFGGAVAPLVAADDPRVAAMVLLGAPARTFRETMRYQLRYTIERDSSVAPERRAAALEQAMGRQGSNVAASREKWRQWLQDRDPLPTARRVQCPVLILHGLTDRAVPPEDAQLLAEAIRGAGNVRVTVQLFGSVNHHFQRDPVGAREGYDRLPTQDLAPEVLEALSDWLAGTLQP